MATREQKLAAVYSEGKTLGVEDPANAGTFTAIPGLMDFTESSGERDTRTTGTDSTRPHGVASNMKASTIEASFLYVEHPTWDIVDNAFINKTNLNFRFETESEIVLAQTASGVTCAIAADGTCTFVGGFPSVDELPLGSAIKIGSALHLINEVTAVSGAVTAVSTKAPASAVSAAQYSVVTPATRVSFRAKVASTPTRQHGLAQQAEREGTLTLQSLSVLPKPTLVA